MNDEKQQTTLIDVLGWIAVPAILAVVIFLSPVAFMFFQIHRSLSEFETAYQEGVPVVDAIYRYYDKHRLWPQHLSDLEDVGYDVQLSDDWLYFWDEYSEEMGPRLWCHGPWHSKWVYLFPSYVSEPNEFSGRWEMAVEGSVRQDSPAQEIPQIEELPSDEVAKRRQEEIDRRKLREPDNSVHNKVGNS